MTVDLTTVIPEGYDPNAPDANRHTYAVAVLAEAHANFNAVERFVVLMTTIKSEGLFKLLGHKTFDDLVLKEFGKSDRTGRRWVEQGNELLALDGPSKAITAGETRTRASGTDGSISSADPNQPASISQRSAAKKAAERRERTKPKPPPGVQPSEPATPGAEPPGRVARGPRTPPEPSVPDPSTPGPSDTSTTVSPGFSPRPDDGLGDWGEPPVGGRSRSTAEDVAKANLEDLLRFMGKYRPAELAAVATGLQCDAITAFAAHFAPVTIAMRGRRMTRDVGVDPKDCKHPVNQRIGQGCGACGKTGLK